MSYIGGVSLRPHQLKALGNIRNGSILCGGVGSGKSITSLAYYYIQQGGKFNNEKLYSKMIKPKDLYIITTARKRDSFEWDAELAPFLLATDSTISGYSNKVVIDSWNNIGKYVTAKNAFFIFDEQRVVGYGSWVKNFIKITKQNDWILLSATPGDTWQDYIPVFIANGFYKNKTEFNQEHVVFCHRSKFPKVDRYLNTKKLIRQRDFLLVEMEFERHTVPHHIDILVDHDRILYKDVTKNRWDPYKNEPIKNAGGLCYILRKIVNSDESRADEILKIVGKHKKCIIFYNFDYELDILRSIDFGNDVERGEWNGHIHQDIPSGSKWVYFVQYNAGSEGWNCISTDCTIFYSQNYSYKVMEQASGRINRLNTPFTDLYYYHLKSCANIDMAISRALKIKKIFNERKYVEGRK